MKIFLAFLGFVAGMLVGLLVRPLQPDDPLMRIVPALVIVLIFGVGMGPALAAAVSSSVGSDDELDEEEWDDDWEESDFADEH